MGGGGFGKPAAPGEGAAAQSPPEGERPPPPANLYTVGDVGGASDRYPPQAGGGPPPPAALPAVGRDEVLGTCAQTSALMAVFGVGLHQLAPVLAPAAHDGNGAALQELLQCARATRAAAHSAFARRQPHHPPPSPPPLPPHMQGPLPFPWTTSPWPWPPPRA